MKNKVIFSNNNNTGSLFTDDQTKLIEYKFNDQLTFTIRVSEDGKFIDIQDVIVNKDFRTTEQMIKHSDVYYDLNKYYPE